MRASENLATPVVWPLPLGQDICVDATPIFPVTPYSRFLLQSLPPVAGKDVLDFGAGCGILGIVAAGYGAASVLSCDVSVEALELTSRNATRNGVSQLRTLLVQPELEHEQIPSSCVDVIVCNPASLPALFDVGSFWTGGRLGNRMILALIEVAARALRANGILRFVHTSLASLSPSLVQLTKHQFSAAIIKVTRIPFRPHYEPLMEHFLALRQQGQVAFDGETIANAYEYLYLISACRAPAPAPGGGEVK